MIELLGLPIEFIILLVFILINIRQDYKIKGLINAIIVTLLIYFYKTHIIGIILLNILSIFIVEIVYEKDRVWYTYGKKYILNYYIYLIVGKYKVLLVILWASIFEFTLSINNNVLSFLILVLGLITIFVRFSTDNIYLKNIMDVNKTLEKIWNEFKVDYEKCITDNQLEILRALEVSLSNTDVRKEILKYSFIENNNNRKITCHIKIIELLLLEAHIYVLANIEGVKDEERDIFEKYVNYLYLKFIKIEEFSLKKLSKLSNEHFYVLCRNMMVKYETVNDEQLKKSLQNMSFSLDNNYIEKYKKYYSEGFIPVDLKEIIEEKEIIVCESKRAKKIFSTTQYLDDSLEKYVVLKMKFKKPIDIRYIYPHGGDDAYKEKVKEIELELTPVYRVKFDELEIGFVEKELEKDKYRMQIKQINRRIVPNTENKAGKILVFEITVEDMVLEIGILLNFYPNYEPGIGIEFEKDEESKVVEKLGR